METPSIHQQIPAVGAPTAAPQTSASTPLAGPSFHALLEKLESQASGLASQSPTNAADLSGAVNEARHSLDAALNLGRDLVEAYREAYLNDADLKQAG